MVRKGGRAFYATLYQEVFSGNPGGGGSLTTPSCFLVHGTQMRMVFLLYQWALLALQRDASRQAGRWADTHAETRKRVEIYKSVGYLYSDCLCFHMGFSNPMLIPIFYPNYFCCAKYLSILECSCRADCNLRPATI